MKKLLAALIAAVFLSSLPGITTITDGAWNDPNVWQGGIVPSASDNVIVTRLVTITGNAECHDLTLQGSDSMVRNNYLTNSSLTVFGRIISTGWITSHAINNNHLTVNLYGDLESYYNFTPGTLNILGSGNRHWNLAEGEGFAPYLGINIAAAIDTVFAASNIQISTSNTGTSATIQGVDSPFVLSLGGAGDRIAHSMTVTNCIVQNGLILGSGTNGFSWTNTRGGYMRNLRLQALNLMSGSSVLMLEGVILNNVSSSATIYNYSSNNQTLTLEGDFVNNGDIRSNPSGYNLYINAYGNIINNGWFAPYYLGMLGTGDRYLGSTAGNPFRVVQSIDFSISLGTIHATTDLAFINSSQINNGLFDLQGTGSEARDLYANGVYFNGSTIWGGAGSEFTGINVAVGNASLYYLTLNASSTVSCAAGCTFTDCINYGIVQNYPSNNQTLTWHGDIYNYGTVRNHPGGYNLYINTYDNINNLGTWQNYSLSLCGTAIQSMSFDQTHPLRVNYCSYNGSAAEITLNSEGSFTAENCSFDFNGRTLQIPEEPFVINLSNCWFGEANVNSHINTVLMFSGTEISQTDFQSVTNSGTFTHRGCVVSGQMINNGTLQNSSNSNYTITITQSLTNNGTIRNNPSGYSQYMYVGGDLVNNGTVSLYQLYLNGSSEQHVALPEDHPFTGQYLYKSGSTTPVIADTDLYLQNCTVDLLGAQLVLSSGVDHKLALNNANLRRAAVISSVASELNMQNAGFLDQVSFQSITFSGAISLESNTTISGTLVNLGVLQNHPSNNKSLYVGVLSNSGSIRNHPSGYTLQLHVLGDTANTGAISCYMFWFDGALCHLASTGSISSPYLYITGVAAELVLQNSMSFSNTEISFTGGSNGFLRLNAARTSVTLTMNNGNIRNANLLGGPGARLNGSGAFVLINSTADEIILGGLVQIENVSIGHLINQGTIRNNTSNNQTLTIGSKLDNYGTITSNISYQLILSLYGDCYDYGWISNYQISFNTNGDQVLYQDACADTLRCQYLYKNTSTGNLVMASDLKTRNTVINLGGHNLQMYRGRSSFGLYMYGGSLSSAFLDTSGYATVWMASSAYLNGINGDNVVFTGSCYLLGTCQYSNVVNNGILRNYPSTWGYLYIPGDLTNNGYIYDATSYNLTLYLGGDFVNYGTTTCYAIYMNGTTGQQVLRGGALNPALFYLVSNIGNSLWYLNAAPSGYNGSTISIPVSGSSVLGDWQPYNQGTLTWGRVISIMIPEAPGAPTNLVISCIEGTMTLQWGQVLNAASYRVYECNTPDGSYSLFRDNIMDNDPEDGLVSISFPGNGAGKFYKVSSRN